MASFSVPYGLPTLLKHYQGKSQWPVPFRPSSWESALASVDPAATRLLRDPEVTISRNSGARGRDGDRQVSREDVRNACLRMDLDSVPSVLGAFVLVMVWGSGLTGGRRLRYTRLALGNPEAAHLVLRKSVELLRASREPDDGGMLAAHQQFRLPGVGQAFYSKWFAFAGYVTGRPWQPLILDARVYSSLNRTLHVDTPTLAGSSNRAARYVAYVSALHAWADKMTDPSATGERLEWVLFEHRGKPLPE